MIKVIVHFLLLASRIRCHSLSFYWGYKDLEHFEWSNGKGEGNSPSTSSDFSSPPVDEKVFSFDVFDTLITRQVATPTDVFDLMADHAAALCDIPAEHFRDRRMMAERKARKKAATSNVQEPTLRAIYSELTGIDHTDKQLDALVELEVLTEIGVSVPKANGRALFEAATRAGKRVILISDMYLSSADIDRILQSCGYAGWNALYVSSEVGKTKRSGDLYQHVVQAEEIAPSELRHHGDTILQTHAHRMPGTAFERIFLVDVKNPHHRLRQSQLLAP